MKPKYKVGDRLVTQHGLFKDYFGNLIEIKEYSYGVVEEASIVTIARENVPFYKTRWGIRGVLWISEKDLEDMIEPITFLEYIDLEEV